MCMSTNYVSHSFNGYLSQLPPPVPQKVKQIYSGYQQYSSATGIPISVLKLAKSMNAPGFGTNNRINHDLFIEWYLQNKDNINVVDNDTIEFYKKENARLDGILKAEQIKKLRKESLDPTEVKQFLESISNKQAVIFKQSIKDLSTKYPHLKSELDELVNHVCMVFSDSSTLWMR